MAAHLYDELLVELECPICTNYMSSPIRMCAAGHNVCDTCCKKLSRCGLCQGKFTDARNLALEGLALKVRYPCINKRSGCNANLSYAERENHELGCPFRGYKCAMEKCPWAGKLEEIVAHWKSKHYLEPFNSDKRCQTTIGTESYDVDMINAHDKLFWSKLKITQNKLYWAVQFLGKAAEAKNYYYEIEIFKEEGSRKKILISDYCQAIDLENSQLFNDGGCVSVIVDALTDFVNFDPGVYNGLLPILNYYVRVGIANFDPSSKCGPALNTTHSDMLEQSDTDDDSSSDSVDSDYSQVGKSKRQIQMTNWRLRHLHR